MKAVKTKKAPAEKKTRPAKKVSGDHAEQKKWILRLYVSGQTPKSLVAFSNLKKLCEEHLPNQHSIEVIDLSKHPEMAANDQIIALPTLVRKLPEPIKRVIGDLSNLDRVLVGMDLKPTK